MKNLELLKVQENCLNTQCGNISIFLSLRFYVIPFLWILEIQNLASQHFLNFDFYEFLQFLKVEIDQIKKIQTPKMAKMLVLELLNSS